MVGQSMHGNCHINIQPKIGGGPLLLNREEYLGLNIWMTPRPNPPVCLSV
jgi:hypothetical protein